jgi:hypothetical protein
MVTDGSRGSTVTAAVENLVQAGAVPGCWGFEPFAMPLRYGTTANITSLFISPRPAGNPGGADKPNGNTHIQTTNETTHLHAAPTNSTTRWRNFNTSISLRPSRFLGSFFFGILNRAALSDPAYNYLICSRFYPVCDCVFLF